MTTVFENYIPVSREIPLTRDNLSSFIDNSSEYSSTSKSNSVISSSDFDVLTKDDNLMKNLITFYSQEYNRTQMIPIVCGESKISLRVLDWFVTNYSKQHQTIYGIKKSDNTRLFSVYNSYKAQLKTFSKRRFDPFCRHKRIYFEYGAGEDEGIETTVGQLNFFKWAIENKVIDYVKNHLNEIIDDMNLRGNKKNSESESDVTTESTLSSGSRKKRELSKAGTKSISHREMNILVNFE